MTDQHVIPMFGRAHDASVDCWCSPRVDDGVPAASGARVWIHEPEAAHTIGSLDADERAIAERTGVFDPRAIRSLALDERQPCMPYPDDASYKTIAVTCGSCGSWRCWLGYLRWEARNGITLNADQHAIAAPIAFEVRRQDATPTHSMRTASHDPGDEDANNTWESRTMVVSVDDERSVDVPRWTTRIDSRVRHGGVVLRHPKAALYLDGVDAEAPGAARMRRAIADYERRLVAVLGVEAAIAFVELSSNAGPSCAYPRAS